MKNIAFLAFDEHSGLTYHFVDILVALDNSAYNDVNIFFITIEKEQEEGLHEKLRKFILKHVKVLIIKGSNELYNLDIFKYIDIVHCNAYRQLAEIIKLKSINNYSFKIGITLHSFRHGLKSKCLFSSIISLLYLNKVDCLHFLSINSYREFFKNNYFIKRSITNFIFPLGINKKEDSDISDNDIKKTKEILIDVKKHSYNIIYIANFRSVKQHIKLIKCIGNYLLEKNIALWLFGEGKLLKKCLSIVKKKKWENNIYLPGRVKRRIIPYLIKSMDLAIVVSKSETFGHTVIEPLLYGIPLIAFNVGIAGDILKDFYNGFLVNKKNNFIELKNKLDYLFRNNKLKETISNNLRFSEYRIFLWENYANSIIHMWNSLIKENE